MFHPLSEPSADEVADVAIMTAHKVLRDLQHGDGHEEDPLALEQPVLAHCYGAAVTGRQAFGPHQGKPVIRRIDAERRQAPSGQTIAEAEGFQVFRDHPIGANDRQAVLSLCRYLTRPPLSHSRLERVPDGRVCYRLKRTSRDGTSAVVMRPEDLIARLCARVPPPRFHLLRFSGVLAPHASSRPFVVPQQPPSRQLVLPGLCEGSDGAQARSKAKTPTRTPWAKMLARIFRVDAETCPRCGGSMRIVDFVTRPNDIQHHLEAHPPRAPPPEHSSTAQLSTPLTQIPLPIA